MFLKSQTPLAKTGLILAGMGFLLIIFAYTSRSKETVEESESRAVIPVKKPDTVKGIHLTAWVAGSKKARERIDSLLKETELNTVVIAVKEFQGQVYIPGVPLAEENKLYVNAIPDIKEYIAKMKAKGIYTVARMVVFKDNSLSRKRKDLAVKMPDGSLWTDHRNIAWTDPYNKKVWEYNLSVATQAVALGFEEVQFDYIRYPSDGDIKLCRYSYENHNTSSSVKNLDAFLETASKRIKALGANVSIAVFGLTTTVQHDMGIGQKITDMTRWVDYVSPMVYPSHYAKGEYGIPEPNKEPYKVVHKSISTAKERLGDSYVKLRPYLQDFSLGQHYGPKEVRAQIQACEDAGIREWLLWDPKCTYTIAALKSANGALSEIAKVPSSMTENIQDRSDARPSSSQSSQSDPKKEMEQHVPLKTENGSEKNKPDGKE